MATGPRLESPHFFKIILSDTLESGKLNVPGWFIRQHILKIKEIATLTHSDRSWLVKLRSYPRGGMLSSGWFTLVRGTRLRAGNVCMFELIDRDDNVFKVHIFSRAGRNKQSKCRTIHSEPVFRDPTPSMPLITPEPANLIRSIPSSNWLTLMAFVSLLRLSTKAGLVCFLSKSACLCCCPTFDIHWLFKRLPMCGTFLVNSPGNIFEETRMRELLGIQIGHGR